MTTVPITKALADELEPLGIGVSINPLIDTVVMHVGDRAIGLPRPHAILLAKLLVDAADSLGTLTGKQLMQ
jgi:hypothetical protein